MELDSKKQTKKGKAVKETPLMKQYNSIKAKHPDALLLFRVGDFYETFGEDAVRAAEILGIVLTKRKNGAAAFVDLAGFPHHSLDTYLPKLVRAGLRVAICDQLELPSATKKIVKRGVTELVTPGVAFNDEVLDRRKNNFLAGIFPDQGNYGIALLDITTGEFLIAEGDHSYAHKILQGFGPSEVLISKSERTLQDELSEEYHTYALDDWVFDEETSRERILRHFGTTSLKGFGVEEMHTGVTAAGALMHYLGETQNDRLEHITSISRIASEEYVWLDRFTVRNLELFDSNHAGGRSLLDVMDHTVTPMGGRLLKRWMLLPLLDIKRISERQDVVQFLSQDASIAEHLSGIIKPIGDLERMISKAVVQKINPRELNQFRRALEIMPEVQQFLSDSGQERLQILADQINPCHTLLKRIQDQLDEDAPVVFGKGKVIKDGVNAELDEYRQIAYSGKDQLIALQENESEKTGIPSLKIGYNNVFGYYLEVRNTHKDKVPEEWIRKQTLTQAERYITPELKEYEEKILNAESRIGALEQELYTELVRSVSDQIKPIQHNAFVIAQLDCLLCFAKLALKNSYIRPVVDESTSLDIQGGRHPVIEMNLPLGEAYVENDVYLDTEEQQIIIITGPNMSGKSALLRQTALIVLLAQMGSFVPAEAATIGLVDKIFTRVGASDNISSGESTFMVEMNETASILNNLSSRSLVLLDEIGRGTSTYDGISIAWAISEFIHEHPLAKAKTLFATHYHELNQMSEEFSRIKNYNVSVKEVDNKVLFLRKLIPGGSAHSFGIHVARMAGMPALVLQRANQVLSFLEKSHTKEKNTQELTAAQQDMQLSFFQLDDPILEQIREDIRDIDINTLTPVEALMKLNEIKKVIGGQ
ncbi:MAG: DNA mismatch repair protein MutS [Flavobacteriales bacterium]|nr:DNA mismatch repair protein MutS [Flavobacteriales bacterium]